MAAKNEDDFVSDEDDEEMEFIDDNIVDGDGEAQGNLMQNHCFFVDCDHVVDEEEDVTTKVKHCCRTYP